MGRLNVEEFLTQRKDLVAYTKLLNRRETGYLAGQIELTSKCFQQCSMCSSWREPFEDRWTELRLARLWANLNRSPHFEHLTLTGGDPQASPLLQYAACLKRRFRLQLTTALMVRPEPWYVTQFDQIRVSLDSTNPSVYKAVRGVDRDPMEVLGWLGEQLWLPSQVSIFLTVNSQNLDDVVNTLLRLELLLHGEDWLRRVILMCELPTSDFVLHAYLKAAKHKDWAIPVSFSEDIPKVREIARSDRAKGWLCHAGDVSFHMKSDTSVYPCCILGGEAIHTDKDSSLGHYEDSGLHGVHNNAWAQGNSMHRGYANKVCRELCQYKQMALNYLGSELTPKLRLSIP